MPKKLSWVEEEKQRIREEAARGFSWEEKDFTFGNLRSENNRRYESAKDDYLRRIQGSATTLVSDFWQRVKTGEFSVDDFQKLIIGEKTGITGGETSSPWVGDISSEWGTIGAGGYDKGQWAKFKQGAEKRRKAIDVKQLAPGMREQTSSGNILSGITKNAAKKTLLGQY